MLTLLSCTVGLFHRAIMESGAAISPWAFVRYPKKTAKAFAESIGCPSTDTKAMVECLRAKPVEDIVEQQIEMVISKFLKNILRPS